MNKKHFVALADHIRRFNAQSDPDGTFALTPFEDHHINELAAFCQTQNPQFNAGRWIGYINGKNGKNGGKV